MPLPRDGEYPYTSKPDWRVAILQGQVDEARTWAIRMKRERDKYELMWGHTRIDRDEVIAQRDKLKRERDELQKEKTKWWTKATNLNFELLVLEREQDELKKALDDLQVSRAHWRESFERVSGERDDANRRLDECAESLRNIYGLWAKAERERDEAIAKFTAIGVSRAEKAEQERDKLVEALQRIKTLPYYTTERVWAVIDAALDGVE